MDVPGQSLDLAITATLSYAAKPRERKSSTPISKITSKSTEVVPFGVTGASNNIRLNKHSRDITVFNYEIISQLVGHLLGDGSLLYTLLRSCPLCYTILCIYSNY